MSSVNFYNRGSQNGIGIQTLWAGILVHVIAWEDGTTDRLPVEDRSSEDLTVRFIGPMKDLISEVNGSDSLESPKPPTPPSPTPDTTITPPSGDLANYPWNDWVVPDVETEAAKIRAFLTAFPTDDNAEVVKALKSKGVEVSSSQVTSARKALAS